MVDGDIMFRTKRTNVSDSGAKRPRTLKKRPELKRFYSMPNTQDISAVRSDPPSVRPGENRASAALTLQMLKDTHKKEQDALEKAKRIKQEHILREKCARDELMVSYSRKDLEFVKRLDIIFSRIRSLVLILAFLSDWFANSKRKATLCGWITTASPNQVIFCCSLFVRIFIRNKVQNKHTYETVIYIIISTEQTSMYVCKEHRVG
jgi:hypothetical protein